MTRPVSSAGSNSHTCLLYTSVNSPTAFVELWTEHVRKQGETLSEQSKQLAALAQKVTLTTAELLKTRGANPLNIAA